MSSEHLSATKSSSPFLSLFARKKRINKSIDDLKGAVAGLSLNNDHMNTATTTITENGYIDSEVPESCSANESKCWAEQPQKIGSNYSVSIDSKVHFDERNNTNINRFMNNHYSQNDRTRYIKSSRKSKRATINDDQSNTLPNRSQMKHFNNQRNDDLLNGQKKSYSADLLYQTDSSYLMEALETLADEQPLVARSIPKHAIIDTSNFAARSLDNCLFDAKVYDTMLRDSLKVFSYFIYLLHHRI